MGVRRAYAYSQQRRVASYINLCNSFCKTWEGGRTSTDHVVSSAEKVVKEGRCSSLVSHWNLASLVETCLVPFLLPGTDV